GQEFDLPVPSQPFGQVPDRASNQRKYGVASQPYDTVNASIGQGYYLASALQPAVTSARLASGRNVQPRLLRTTETPGFPSLGFSQDYIAYVRQAMRDAVHGPGTAGRA